MPVYIAYKTKSKFAKVKVVNISPSPTAVLTVCICVIFAIITVQSFSLSWQYHSRFSMQFWALQHPRGLFQNKFTTIRLHAVCYRWSLQSHQITSGFLWAFSLQLRSKMPFEILIVSADFIASLLIAIAQLFIVSLYILCEAATRTSFDSVHASRVIERLHVNVKYEKWHVKQYDKHCCITRTCPCKYRPILQAKEQILNKTILKLQL